MTVTQVRRISSGLVEISIDLENKTDCELYFPSHGTGEWLAIHTLEVQHWDSKRGWLPLGPFYDLPADTAVRLQPGKTYSLVHRMQDPSITPLPGQGIPVRRGEAVPLRGKHRVRVSYICGEAEWRAYRADLERSSPKTAVGKAAGPTVHLKHGDSAEFDIPPSKP